MSRLLNSLIVAAGETGMMHYEDKIETAKQDTIRQMEEKYAMRAEERAFANRMKELDAAHGRAKELATFEAGLNPKTLPPGVKEAFDLYAELAKNAEWLDESGQATLSRLNTFLAPYLGGEQTGGVAGGATGAPAVADTTGATAGAADKKSEPPWVQNLRNAFRKSGSSADPAAVADKIIRNRGLSPDDPAAKAIREQVYRIAEEEKPGLISQAGDAISQAAGAAADAISGYEQSDEAAKYGAAAKNPGADASIEAAQGAGGRGVVPTGGGKLSDKDLSAVKNYVNTLIELGYVKTPEDLEKYWPAIGTATQTTMQVGKTYSGGIPEWLQDVYRDEVKAQLGVSGMPDNMRGANYGTADDYPPSAADYRQPSTADQSIAAKSGGTAGPQPAAPKEPEKAPEPGDVGKSAAVGAGQNTRQLLDAADAAVVSGWDALGRTGQTMLDAAATTGEKASAVVVDASTVLSELRDTVADFLRGYTGTQNKAVDPEKAKSDAIKIVGELRKRLRSMGTIPEAEISAAVTSLRSAMEELRTSSPAAYRATKPIFEKQINELLGK